MSAESLTGVTVQQQEALIEFLEIHKELALGRFSRTKEGRSLSKRLWTECSNILNSVSANCPTRGPEAWRAYFADYKSKLLRKIKKNKQEISATGGGHFSQTDLTPLQERLYTLLGRDVGEPIAGVRHNPLDMAAESTEDGDTQLIEMSWDPMVAPSSDWPIITASEEMTITSVEMATISAETATTSAETATTSAEMPTTSTVEPTTRREEPPRRHRRRHHREHEPEETPLQAAEQRLTELESRSTDAMFALAQAIEHLATSLDNHNRRPIQVEIMNQSSRRRGRLQTSSSDSE